MNNSKKTRKALLSSIVALMLCFSMFVGTTMAWFTDTATTSVNTIQAGTLKIDLLMDKAVNGDYVSIDDTSESIFTKAENANETNATLWEPGKTQVAYLAIKNEGNLAAKYSVDILAVKPADATADMTKVMKYAITPDAEKGNEVTAWVADDAKSLNLGTTRATKDIAIDAGAMHKFALSIHMDELAGNEYQGQSVEFYIAVTATQQTAEADSFGTTYDANATYEATLAAGTAKAAVTVTGEGANKVVKAAAETTVEAYNAEDSTTPVAKVIVPAGTELEDEAGSISIKVTPTDLYEKVEVTSEQGAKTYDVDVTGVKEDEVVQVELYVGTGLTGLRLFHEDEEIPYDSYDATTGIVTFTTDSFSPYTVIYNASSDLPVATINSLGKKTIKASTSFNGSADAMDLDAAFQFLPNNTVAEAQASKYRYWHADFVVSANKEVPAETIALAGYYVAFCKDYNNDNWITLTNPTDIPANTEIRLVEGMANGAITVNFEEICGYSYYVDGDDQNQDESNIIAKDKAGFHCGLADVNDKNEGTTVTVELRLYETYTEEECEELFGYKSKNEETGEYVVIATKSFTF